MSKLKIEGVSFDLVQLKLQAKAVGKETFYAMHKAANWANYPAQDQKRLIDEIWAIATKDDPSKKDESESKKGGK